MANTVQKPIKLCEEDSGVIEDEAVVETELINNIVVVLPPLSPGDPSKWAPKIYILG